MRQPSTSGYVSVLSALCVCWVVFNTGVSEGRCDLRRRRNSKQLLQPSPNLSPFFNGCWTERRRRSLINANNSPSDMGEGLSSYDEWQKWLAGA